MTVRCFIDLSMPNGVVWRKPRETDRIAYPAGTRFSCEAGHHTATLCDDLHMRSMIEYSHFGPPPPYQARATYRAKLGYCLCGRAWSKVGLITANIMALHVLGQGWQDVDFHSQS